MLDNLSVTKLMLSDYFVVFDVERFFIFWWKVTSHQTAPLRLTLLQTCQTLKTDQNVTRFFRSKKWLMVWYLCKKGFSIISCSIFKGLTVTILRGDLLGIKLAPELGASSVSAIVPLNQKGPSRSTRLCSVVWLWEISRLSALISLPTIH